MTNREELAALEDALAEVMDSAGIDDYAEFILDRLHQMGYHIERAAA